MLARAYAGVILTVIIWGGNAVLLKVLLHYVPAGVINAGRLGLSALVLVSLMLIRVGLPRLTLREWLAVGAVGLVGNSFFQLLFLAGIERSPAGISSVVPGIVPVWVALLAPLLRMPVTARQACGIALSLAGLVALAVVSSQPGVPVNPVGLALLVGAALTWAVYTLANRPLAAKLGTLPFVALSLALGGLPFVVLYADDIPRVDAPTLAWVGVAASGLFANVFAYLAWAYGVRVLGAARTSVMNNLAPVVGLLLAVTLLHERYNAPVWVAVALVLAGVVLTNWPERQQTAVPLPGES